MGLRIATATVVASLLATRGIKRKSLSKSGAIAAWFVGFFSLAGLVRSGIVLIVFYLTSSKLTKVKSNIKKTLEEDYVVGGERGAVQVLCCSFLATVLSIAHYFYVGEDGLVLSGDAVHRAISLGVVSHYATCAADTWASELGILNKRWPVLITNMFKSVPPGTNGGVSEVGTLASAAGGVVIGLTYWLSGAIVGAFSFEDWVLTVYGLVFGVVGSFLDSILGATLQQTLYNEKTKKITTVRGANVVVICGTPILDNQEVNLISVSIMTLLGMGIGYFGRA